MSYIQFSFYGDFSVSISWQSLFLLFSTNLWQPVLINIMRHVIVSHILFSPYTMKKQSMQCTALIIDFKEQFQMEILFVLTLHYKDIYKHVLTRL
jgi:hypothetical protein